MAEYIAIIHKDAESDYGVSFPDFPGCVTAGSSLEEARKLAAEALDLHVRGLREDRQVIPPPTSLDEIAADPEYTDALAVVVIHLPDTRSVRVNVSLPVEVLAVIDEAAERAGLTRSAFLAEAGLKAAAEAG
jgi:predicted RNase H-like HicB family nuclease